MSHPKNTNYTPKHYHYTLIHSKNADTVGLHTDAIQVHIKHAHASIHQIWSVLEIL